MGTSGEQSVTVSAAERVYKPAWIKRYAGDLKRGNTATKKAPITDGISYMRLTHDANKGVERHIVSLEDETVDVDGEVSLEKINITLTCRADDTSAESRLIALSLGMLAWLAETGILDSIVADEL